MAHGRPRCQTRPTGCFIWPAQCLEVERFRCPFFKSGSFFKGWIWLRLLAAGSASGLRAGHALMGSVHCFKGHCLLTSPDHPASYSTFWTLWVFGIRGPYSSALFCTLGNQPSKDLSDVAWGVRLCSGD